MIFPNLKCYNFVSQNVSSLPNESLAFCSTNSQFINVRKHDAKIYVEISDLDHIDQIQNRFQVPFYNVDKVIYCDEGNYLAIVGIDSNQFAKICIYFNWWLEEKNNQKSKCILNLFESSSSSADKEQDENVDQLSSKINRSCLEYVEIKTDYFKEEETKYVKIECCEKSGNLLIGYVNRVQIYKYIKKYSINNRPLSNNFIHLIDVEIKLSAQHFKLTEQLLLCSSFEHCQVINLDFQADIHLDSKINLYNINQKRIESKQSDKKAVIRTQSIDEKTIYLSLFQNEQLKVTNGHLNEIIGPISDRYCCKIDVKFDSCLQVNTNNINILFCLNLLATKPSLVEHQFEIIEEDGYSQIHPKNKSEVACKAFLLPVYNDRLDDRQLNEDNNPLAEIEDEMQNLLHSKLNSKLIYYNFFLFKNDHLAYYLIDTEYKIEKFKLNQIDIKNFNLKSVIIDKSFIYILTKDSLYTYYFGLFNILNYVHQLKFTSTLDQNLNQLLKTVRPILLNKNSFLGSHQLINTSVQLIVLSQDDQLFTKYSLKKPSYKQLLYDAKENLIVLEQELNQKQKISFYFYLINLCKSIKLNQELDSFYVDYCLLLFKLLINNFPSTSAARKLIMEFMFKYTKLTVYDMLEKDDRFLFKFFEEINLSILEEILDQLVIEDKLNQQLLFDSLYDYEQQELLSRRVLSNMNDSNLLKLIQYLSTNSANDLIVYLIFNHQFTDFTLFENDNLIKSCIGKCKMLFDCERFDELKQLFYSTNEMNLYCELVNYKDFIIPSIDFLSYLVKLDLAKMLRFLHKLISFNISSEFIFSIFKDNKHLFILLDNYLCVTRSEQLAEKLLINLVVNFWKILNNELSYDTLCDELGLKYQWSVYQTPFINLIRPYNDEDTVQMNATFSSTFNKLQFILNVYSSNNEIRSLLNHLISHSTTPWSWRLQVQISEFSDAISILYDKRPEIILFYILEQQTMNDEKWKILIDFLDKKQKEHGLDTKLNHKVLYHLANILSPLEFIKLIPTDWKPIMNYYFRICLEKYQAKCIKNQIMSYLDKDYLSNNLHLN